MNNFGMGPHTLGGDHIPMCWPYFRKQIERAGNTAIPLSDDLGIYPVNSGSNTHRIFITYDPTVEFISLDLDIVLDYPDFSQPTADNPNRHSDTPILILYEYPGNEISTQQATFSIEPWDNLNNVTTEMRIDNFFRVNRKNYTITAEQLRPVSFTLDKKFIELCVSDGNVGIYQNILGEGSERKAASLIKQQAESNLSVWEGAYTYATFQTRGYIKPFIAGNIKKIVFRAVTGADRQPFFGRLTLKYHESNFFESESGEVADNLCITGDDMVFLISEDKWPIYIDAYTPFGFSDCKKGARIEFQLIGETQAIKGALFAGNTVALNDVLTAMSS